MSEAIVNEVNINESISETSMYQLNICHLYPDLLNLYGDRGNIIALAKRASWRGIQASISSVTLGEAFDAEKYDIIFLGGGQDYEQEIIQDDLLMEKGNEIKSAIENNVVFLCICGGYQLLGKYYRTWEGKEINFLGALDLWTIGGKKRLIGNMVFECDFLKSDGSDGRNVCDGKVAGFENHSGKTYLGPSVSPLGKVLKGGGNNGEDGFEGAMYKNVLCSYSHGSLLPKNPALADHLVERALRRKYSQFTSLAALDDGFEKLAREAIISKLL